jgi:glycerol-3-phosphate dehydrogenase
MAALEFGMKHEAVQSPLDFFIRRTGFLYFEPWRIAPVYKAVMHRMSEYLSWSAETGHRMHGLWLNEWKEVEGLREGR